MVLVVHKLQPFFKGRCRNVITVIHFCQKNQVQLDHYSVFEKNLNPNTEGITADFKGSTVQWFLIGTGISLRSGPAANPRYPHPWNNPLKKSPNRNGIKISQTQNATELSHAFPAVLSSIFLQILQAGFLRVECTSFHVFLAIVVIILIAHERPKTKEKLPWQSCILLLFPSWCCLWFQEFAFPPLLWCTQIFMTPCDKRANS